MLMLNLNLKGVSHDKSVEIYLPAWQSNSWKQRHFSLGLVKTKTKLKGRWTLVLKFSGGQKHCNSIWICCLQGRQVLTKTTSYGSDMSGLCVFGSTSAPRGSQASMNGALTAGKSIVASIQNIRNEHSHRLWQLFTTCLLLNILHIIPTSLPASESSAPSCCLLLME